MNNIPQKGFTLIELMMTVAIIGVLVSIALPGYQRYTIRTTATPNVVGAIRPIQLAVNEFAQRHNKMPTPGDIIREIGSNDETSSCFGITEKSVYSQTDASNVTITTHFLVDGTAINATCGGETLTVPKGLSGETVIVNGVLNTSGSVTWKNFNAGTLVNKYEPRI